MEQGRVRKSKEIRDGGRVICLDDPLRIIREQQRPNFTKEDWPALAEAIATAEDLGVAIALLCTCPLPCRVEWDVII